MAIWSTYMDSLPPPPGGIFALRSPSPSFFLARSILHHSDSNDPTLSEKRVEGKFLLGDGKRYDKAPVSAETGACADKDLPGQRSAQRSRESVRGTK